MKRKAKAVVISMSVLMVFCLLVAMVYANSKDNQPKAVKSGISLNHFDDQPVLGKKDAPATIIEFGDFKCPGCKHFASDIYPRLIKDYINTGKASFKFVNFPIIGPDSLTAAAAGEYVAKNSPEDFWAYYEQIFKLQKDESENWATIAYLVEIAKITKVKVDYKEMERSLKAGEFDEMVNKDLNFSRELGIRQTPTLVVNGMAIETGGLDYEQIKIAINDVISKKEEKK
ncbi:DsbA family protein [Paenibacillus terrae]|uniref:DsbA family protein n=1 Tax=Paenibacillus terrae TaxID=159743 RepID=UPI0005CB8F29|nr:thioredoxin domain-containing protein [Paenibacillus terrae]